MVGMRAAGTDPAGRQAALPGAASRVRCEGGRAGGSSRRPSGRMMPRLAWDR